MDIQNKMETQKITNKEQLKQDWKNCYIVGLRVKTLKSFLEAFEIGITIYKRGEEE